MSNEQLKPCYHCGGEARRGKTSPSDPHCQEIALLRLANKNANLALGDKCDEMERLLVKAPSVSEEEVLRAIWLWNTEKHSKHTQITLHQSKELAKVIKELIKKGVGDV